MSVCRAKKGVHKSVQFSEAEERVQVPFLFYHQLECDNNGLEYTVENHDITLKIPKGALFEGEKIHFEIGVAMYGPFNFPENSRSITPIIWLCILENIQLKKPFQLILPHFLTGLTKEELRCHQIQSSKANHNNRIVENGQVSYKFDHLDTKPLLAIVSSGEMYRSYGVIKSTHCCYYCLSAKQTPELARDAGYCLARIERSLLPRGNEVYFIAVYFLETCIQVNDLYL